MTDRAPPTGRARVVTAALIITGACAALALSTGVEASEVGRSLAYDMLFVLAPGVAVVRLLDARGSALRLAALGWLAGILLAAAAFAACAEAGARPAFFAYPAVVVVGAWLAGRRRATDPAEAASDLAEHLVLRSRLATWGLVAVVAGALLIAWPLRLQPDPLPRDLTSAVSYDRDTLYYLGLAADAERQGVPGYPGVSGSPLDFPDLAFVDAGARAFATGIDPAVVMLRLQRLSLIVAAALAFALAGAVIGGRVATAPVAAGLALVTGELDVNADPSNTSLFAIPPYIVTEEQIDLLLGSAMFIAALVLLWEMLPGARQGPVPRMRWVLALAFVLGAAEAKGGAAPVLFGGSVCLVAWAVVAARPLLGNALRILAITTAGFAWLYLVVVRGSAYGVTVRPFAIFDDMTLFQQFLDVLPHGFARGVGWAAGVPAWLLGAFGGLLCGVPWALACLGDADRRRLLAWPLACLVAGTGPLILLDQVGAGERDFAWFGVYAAIPASAAGLVTVASSRPRLVAAAAPALAAVLLVATVVQPGTTQLQRYGWAIGAALLVPLVAGALVLAAGQALPRWHAAAAVATVGLLAAAVLDRPIDVWSRLPVLDDRGTPPPTEIRADGDLVSGYTWIADHTPRDAVLALAPIAAGEPNRYFLLTAFAHRPVFIEGWGNSRRSADVGFARVFSGEVQPFPEREALNRRAFAGDARARAELRDRYGVRWLVVDRLNGVPVRTARLGHAAFANSAVAVFAVR